nr:MAG TPA: hypothetical protein [Caudoviricetes sp.]
MFDPRNLKYDGSPIMKSLVYPKYYSKKYAESNCNIRTNKEFQDTLTELIMMISSQNPEESMGYTEALSYELRDIMKRLMKKGATVFDKLPVEKNSRLVEDGCGVIYCGRAYKDFKPTDMLNKKVFNKILPILRKRCERLPMIMFSKVMNSTDDHHAIEKYYYFFPASHYVMNENNIEYPIDAYVCNFVQSSEQQIAGNVFKHFMLTQLDNVVYCHGIDLDYGFTMNNENSRKIIADMPMGTIIKFDDRTMVKCGPIGSFCLIGEYNGAIEI